MILIKKTSARIQAAFVHLFLSALVVGGVAFLVFSIWYPYPYAQISGGRELFIILVSVDVLVGPLITLIIFAPQKPQRERVVDMVVVVVLQISALAYGVWTMSQARPVQLVYEYGRFGVAHAVEVDTALIPMDIRQDEAYPWNGPKLKSLRAFQTSEEEAVATLVALSGAPLAARADLWQPYSNAVQNVLQQSKPLSSLLAMYPAREQEIVAIVSKAGVDVSTVRYLPLTARGQFWTVFVNSSNGAPVAFAPIDSF